MSPLCDRRSALSSDVPLQHMYDKYTLKYARKLMTHERILKLVHRYWNIEVRFYKERWTSFLLYLCKFTGIIIILYDIRWIYRYTGTCHKVMVHR